MHNLRSGLALLVVLAPLACEPSSNTVDAATLDGKGAADFLASTDGAVDAANIADGAVSTEKIADAAVTTAKIANGAVNTAQIADGSITAAKIDSTDLDAATVGGVTRELLREQRCFTVKHAEAGLDTIPFDLPMNCFSPVTGGLGCTGELYEIFPATPTQSTSLQFQLAFMQLADDSFLAHGAVANSSSNNNVAINAAAGTIVQSSTAGCAFRTTSAGTKAVADGFTDLTLFRANSSRICSLRICEPLLEHLTVVP